MPVNKINGIAYSSIAKVAGKTTSQLAKMAGQTLSASAPAATASRWVGVTDMGTLFLLAIQIEHLGHNMTGFLTPLPKHLTLDMVVIIAATVFIYVVEQVP